MVKSELLLAQFMNAADTIEKDSFLSSSYYNRRGRSEVLAFGHNETEKLYDYNWLKILFIYKVVACKDNQILYLENS